MTSAYGEPEGPWYGEVRLRPVPLLSIGAGWLQAAERLHGPRISLVSGPFLLRFGDPLGHQPVVQVALEVWGTLGWVWTR